MHAIIHVVRQEIQAAEQCADTEIGLAREYGFPFWLAVATGLQGWVRAMRGREDEGMILGAQGAAAYQATGARVNGTFGPTLMAAGSLRREQPDEGLAILAGGLALVDNTGERIWEAELYRLKGELTLQSGVQSLASRVKKSSRSKVQGPKLEKTNPQSPTPNLQAEAEAEACFRQAIAIARRQEAKIFELRAVMSLSRLWRQQGKTKAARKVLSEICDWFTEGFETPDLQDAKTLCAQLT